MPTFTVSEPLFIDTWGWLVMANGTDRNHRDVARLITLSEGRPGQWLTTDYVLDETITRLFAQMSFRQASGFFQTVFDSAASGSLIIETIDSDRFQSAWRLRLRYHDKPKISFTDLTSFVVMREMKVKYVLTGDAHFSHVGLGFHVLP